MKARKLALALHIIMAEQAILTNNAYDYITLVTTRIDYWQFPERSYPQTANNDPQRVEKRII